MEEKERIEIANQKCKNCNHSIIHSAKYCSNCGQKNTDGRISVGSFFTVFFSTVFNLESKFFQTIGDVLVPGKLTVEYFKGKHKRYFHPVRFFIVSALFLIAAIGYQLTEQELNIGNIHSNAEKQVRKAEYLGKVNIAAQRTLEKFPNSVNLKPAFDTLYQSLQGEETNNRDSIDMNKVIITKGFDNLDFRISNEDFLNLSPNELVEKYKVKKRFERFLFKQKIKLIKDKSNFAPFVLGNTLWIILLLMPFLAFILKILYIRHDYYYVEHLVFSFHTHAFAFLLFAGIGFSILIGAPTWIIPIGLSVLFLYLYKALRKVYGQSRFKTFVKLLITNGVYFFLFVFFLAFGLVASMALF